MRKITILCMLLLSLVSVAFANAKTFTATYTPAEVEQITGEKYSTDYFVTEYEKLALLQRCELSLKTIPLPLLNLEKYAALGADKQYDVAKHLGVPALSELKENLRIDKLGKNKIITIVHHYRQGDNVVTANTSFFAVNDKLGVLTSVNKETATNNEEAASNVTKADKSVTKQVLNDDKQPVNNSKASQKELAKNLSSNLAGAAASENEAVKLTEEEATDAAIENLKLSDLDPQQAKEIWKQHCNAVKNAIKSMKAEK